MKNSDIFRRCHFFFTLQRLKHGRKEGNWEGEAEEWEEWKTGGRGEGQGATTRVAVEAAGCAAGRPNGLRWDTWVREVRKRAGIFPGRLPRHVNAHTNTADTHTQKLLSSLLSSLSVVLTSSYSSRCLPSLVLLSSTPSLSFLLFSSLPSLLTLSTFLPLSPAFLPHSLPISASPPLQSPSVALVRQPPRAREHPPVAPLLRARALIWQPAKNI